MGGLTIIYSNNKARTASTTATLFRNYFLIGATSSCIFFTLSFHLIPAASSSSSSTSSPSLWCRLWMHLLLHFLWPLGIFRGSLKSYVREEDEYMMIFCLEWVVLTLAFFLKYYANVDGGDNSMKRNAKVQQMEDEDIPNPPRSHYIRCRLWMHLPPPLPPAASTAVHMLATVLSLIFQGSVSVLIFTRTGDFLGNLKSYVREEDGSMILKLAGGLCVLIFCLEWVVLTLAFFLKYYANVGGGDNSMKSSAKVQKMEDEDFPSLILSSVL
ncbi:hypothetical protein Acr_00g0030730 [Actinidia rufa]|uniref:Uncharacterized protein n=1 Tax=Actinidia rufa TaxID=165716 RepID=A0A7J0DGS4_9ERIC|nr:hypothetical protein Acr_00g0030730 [Actinidia rufa]